MTEVRKKCWPEFFNNILEGKKKFELRLADFEIREGNTLILEEWDPVTKEYTGRKIEKKISFVLHTKDIKFWNKEDIDKLGFVVMSLD